VALKSLPTLKDPERERRLFQNRLVFAALGIVLAVCLILARLAWLQVINHAHYTTLSQENRLKILPLAPPRGLIYSRDGVVLAENRPSFSLTVVPENVADLPAALDELARLLSLSAEERERFNR